MSPGLMSNPGDGCGMFLQHSTRRYNADDQCRQYSLSSKKLMVIYLTTLFQRLGLHGVVSLRARRPNHNVLLQVTKTNVLRNCRKRLHMMQSPVVTESCAFCDDSKFQRIALTLPPSPNVLTVVTRQLQRLKINLV
jgi:hypothetical protein